MDALSRDLPDAATGLVRAPSLPASEGLLCHTPQPIPPIDDEDDDDEDEEDRGSGGGNIDPDDDEGGSDDDDDDDEDDTLWTTSARAADIGTPGRRAME
jgi:hypothetical protein